MQDLVQRHRRLRQRDRCGRLPRADHESLHGRQPVHAHPGAQLPACQHCAAVIQGGLRRDRSVCRIVFLHQQGAVVALLRNIGNNAIGCCLQYGRARCRPTSGRSDEVPAGSGSKMNNLNINSCQAAEGIVTAVGSMLTDKTQEKEGKIAGAQSESVFGDVFESWDEWKKPLNGQNIRTRPPSVRLAHTGKPSIRAMSCGGRCFGSMGSSTKPGNC